MNPKENNPLSRKATFRSKENTTCPICKAEHQKEQMFQGGGRLIAGKINPELRRLYEKNKKYGRLNPNDYVMVVCPNCYYSAFSKDFSIMSPEDSARLKIQTNDRKINVEKILGPIDFSEDRNIASGAASFLLGIDCYQNRAPLIAPSPKKAVCALKAAWYFSDIAEEFPSMNFDKVRDILYQKAAIWYGETLDIMQTGSEPVDSAVGILGPDTDNNWGFDGVMYLNAYLRNKFKEQLASTPEEQVDLLVKAKRMLSRIYGSGKSSKSKPSVLIEMTKELYEQLGETIDAMGGEKT